jgi:hypothetical protein
VVTERLEYTTLALRFLYQFIQVLGQQIPYRICRLELQQHLHAMLQLLCAREPFAHPRSTRQYRSSFHRCTTRLSYAAQSERKKSGDIIVIKQSQSRVAFHA